MAVTAGPKPKSGNSTAIAGATGGDAGRSRGNRSAWLHLVDPLDLSDLMRPRAALGQTLTISTDYRQCGAKVNSRPFLRENRRLFGALPPNSALPGLALADRP